MTRAQKMTALATVRACDRVLRQLADELALAPEQQKAADRLTIARAELIIARSIIQAGL